MYQQQSIDNIISRIDKGAVRISVVMPCQRERGVLSIFLAQELRKRYSTNCVVICDSWMACEFLKNEMDNYLDSNPIECMSADDFFKGQGNKAEFYIFHDLTKYKRYKIFKFVRNKKCKTISFFSPWPEETEKWETNANLKRQIIHIFETKSILDIRDLREADETEKGYIKSEVSKMSGELEVFSDNMDERKKSTTVQLDKCLNKLKEIKQEAQNDHAFHAVDIYGRQIRNETEEIERLKKIINELESLTAQQKQMISFYEELCNYIGISPEDIRKTFNEIEEIRNSLLADLSNNDEEVRETAFRTLQDKATEAIKQLVSRECHDQDRQYYCELLKEELTLKVWIMLDEQSRTFLLTAKYMYDNLAGLSEKDSFDYSGVCLLVTKALELETAKRFFRQYSCFLTNKYDSITEWPAPLLVKRHNNVSVIPDCNFTLGKVTSILGYKRIYDSEGNITEFQLADKHSHDDFVEYAALNLFRNPENNLIELELEKDNIFIEKVRVDYRNPSAHRNAISITTAKECLDYVLDVKQMLRQMLEPMKSRSRY